MGSHWSRRERTLPPYLVQHPEWVFAHTNKGNLVAIVSDGRRVLGLGDKGTAAVTLAGLLNALKVVGKTKEAITIALIGAGAANITVARLLSTAGSPPGHMCMVDTKGILHTERDDLRTPEQRNKWRMCKLLNQEGRQGGIPEALREADVCIAFARSGPGVIHPQWVASMAQDAIVLVCANP